MTAGVSVIILGPCRDSKPCHTSLGGEHGERIAFVKDRFVTAFGGASKMRPDESASASPKISAIG